MVLLPKMGYSMLTITRKETHMPLTTGYRPTNSFLEQSKFFQQIPEEVLSVILNPAELRQVQHEAFIFWQGELAKTFYVLMDGRVRLTQTTVDGHQVILRFVETGCQFGCFSVLEGTVYPATAQALTDSLLFVWSRPVILNLMVQYPQLATNIHAQLFQRLQYLQDDFVMLATQKVEQRLAFSLVRLTKHVGQKIDNGILLDLALTRQDLADMIGTTLHTVSRILSQWQRNGLVELGRERVIIRKLQQLEQFVDNLL